MYYSKEQLEEIRKRGEERLKEQEEKASGHKYQSEDGVQVVCVHCKHDHFNRESALLNTRGLTFLGLDWLNEAATTLICTRCGYIHWFAKEVQQI
jgi:predicted nucleic-acid-binding Zn-ribbon protein